MIFFCFVGGAIRIVLRFSKTSLCIDIWLSRRKIHDSHILADGSASFLKKNITSPTVENTRRQPMLSTSHARGARRRLSASRWNLTAGEYVASPAPAPAPTRPPPGPGGVDSTPALLTLTPPTRCPETKGVVVVAAVAAVGAVAVVIPGPDTSGDASPRNPGAGAGAGIVIVVVFFFGVDIIRDVGGCVFSFTVHARADDGRFHCRPKGTRGPSAFSCESK